ncbi:MAG: alpha-galactosidase [Erythrobacter sp.]
MPAPAPSPHFLNLRGGGTLIALEVTKGARPRCLYAGVDLPGADATELALLSTRQHAPGGSSVPLRGSLINEIGTGLSGPSGLVAHRSGKDWAIDLRLVTVEQPNEHTVQLSSEDANTGIACCHTIAIDPQTGMATCSTQVENRAEAELELDWCAALHLPLDPQLNQIMSFTGRWSGEFQVEQTETLRGSIVRENKTGRTSHDVFPSFIAHSPDTSEISGPAAGFHLAWSGNSRLRADQHNDGSTFVQMGELWFPGEIRLVSGETYRTPDMLAVWSDSGIGDISQRFHEHLTRDILDRRSFAKPRPVHYNTWEAVYFDHDEDALLALADKAASVGAERFVLDDGWFGGRRNDKTGLGDWWVSDAVYPKGLHALTTRVKSLGMEFGLWFEPEMVNPDSDLFRAHPDWVLQADGVEAVPFRGQHTLDLTKPAVFDYLFEKITALVAEYDIAYIKWDMNRDTNYPGSGGRGAMHRQTLAVYQLMAKLREAHKELEIESCSSGGGRADFGILRYTDRIWTSDNNDARARQSIQRGASYFFPLRVLGSHVGPERCHITGRRFDMAFRVGSAIFGHMGMEVDLRKESADDLGILKAGIALHKKHRKLIHQGRFLRLSSASHTNLVGCVAADASEALFSYAKLEEQPQTQPNRIRFDGLDPAKQYCTRLVWPEKNPSISAPSIVDAADLTGKGSIFSGAALMGYGIQPPLTFPDTCLIYHLEATD